LNNARVIHTSAKPLYHIIDTSFICDIQYPETVKPKVHDSCFVHPTAVILGNVIIHENCGIWPHAVIRGDEDAIEIGAGSNVQDCCVLHVTEGSPIRIGKNVSIGHGSTVHGAVIDDDVIIGMNAVLMNGSSIGSGSIIGANAVVKLGMNIPPGSLVVGIPGKIIKEGDEKLREEAVINAETYQRLAREHKSGKYPRYGFED
jgi:carbonic anhydrase/acetyltransferase-like protein (isoleucine patch superfamily)